MQFQFGDLLFNETLLRGLVVSIIRCRGYINHHVLAVIWFMLYSSYIGIALLFLIWILYYAGYGYIVKPGVIDSAVMISVFCVVYFMWRSFIFVRSDAKLRFDEIGASVLFSGGDVYAVVDGVNVKIIFDRPFLDYWPHPRGTRYDVVCGKRVKTNVGGYNPRYMCRMARVEFCLDGYFFGRECSMCSGDDAKCCGDKLLSIKKILNELFGGGVGDWEMVVASNNIYIIVRSGSWEGELLWHKVINGIDFMRDNSSIFRGKPSGPLASDRHVTPPV